MECKIECHILSQLQDIKTDLTDIKNVIFRFDGIIAKQDKLEIDCINRSDKMELEMKSEIEGIKSKNNTELLELKNRIDTLQNRFTYIWTGITFIAPIVWIVINHFFLK